MSFSTLTYLVLFFVVVNSPFISLVTSRSSLRKRLLKQIGLYLFYYFVIVFIFDISFTELVTYTLGYVIIQLIARYTIFSRYAGGIYLANNGMAPTLKKGDRLLVRKYKTPPQRGNIIIFQAIVDGNNKSLRISRIVGLPGEEIKIQQGSVYIDDKPLQEEYLSDNFKISLPAYKIPSNKYFVLADNPATSNSDSRTLGVIQLSNIKGFASFIFWPLKRRGRLL